VALHYLGAGILIAITVFFCIYKLMPDHKVRWGEALREPWWPRCCGRPTGAFSTARAGLRPSEGIRHYGVVVALLTWVYASSLIALYGASFSARLHGPENAERSVPPALWQPYPSHLQIKCVSSGSLATDPA